MARGKNSGGNGSSRAAGILPRETVAKIWNAVAPSRVLDLLNREAPGQKWMLRNTHDIMGCCPFHNDRTPSFHIDFKKRRANCYGSCNLYFNDLVALFAKLKGMQYASALVWLNKELNLANSVDIDAPRLDTYNKTQEMKRQAARAFTMVTLERFRDKTAYLDYLEPGMVYLETGRGIPIHKIEGLPVAVFPKPEHALKYMDTDLHALYMEYFKDWNESTWAAGSIVFWYNDIPDSISSFKLRKKGSRDDIDAMMAQNDNGTATRDSIRPLWSKDFVLKRDDEKAPVGLFGINHYERLFNQGMSEVYITEGEFDALSFMVAQEDADVCNMIMLAMGGNSSGGNVSLLGDLGIRTVYVVADSVEKNGQEIVKSILSCDENFNVNSNEQQLKFMVFEWPHNQVFGNDLDDMIHLNQFNDVSEQLYTERTINFLPSLQWIRARCMEDIDVIKHNIGTKLEKDLSRRKGVSDEEAEDIKSRLSMERKSEILKKVSEWMNYIKSSSDIMAFAESFHADDVDITKLEEYRNRIQNLYAVEGEMSVLIQRLREHMDFAFYTQDSKYAHSYYCWVKDARELAPWPASDEAAYRSVSMYLKRPVAKWMESIFGNGENSVLNARVPKDAALVVRSKIVGENARQLLKDALESMLSSCRNKDTMVVRDQGIHHLDLRPEVRRKCVVYIANGDLLFKGTYPRNEQDKGQPPRWEKLDSTMDDGTLFNMNHGKKWSFIEGVSDLDGAVNINLKRLYNDNKKILQGWKFKGGDLIPTYLAAFVMSLATQAAIGQVSVMFVTGPSNSGKTSLLHGLFGGYQSSGHDVSTIVEGACCLDDSTEAYIRQEMGGSTMLLCLDEAEIDVGATNHSDNVKSIQKMIYSVPTGGSSIGRGGQTTDQRTAYNLRMPIIMAAINMNKDPTFLSRLFVVETVKDLHHKPLDVYIDENFTQERMVQIRKENTIALLPYLFDLMEARKKLRMELLEVKKDVGVAVSDRFVDSLLPALTVYRFVDPENHDAVKLFKEIVYESRDRINSIQSVNDQNDVLNAVLYSDLGLRNMDSSAGTNGTISVRYLLTNNLAMTLNKSSTGIFYDAEAGRIIIVWKLAKHGVLNTNRVYNNKTEAELYNFVLNNKYVIGDVPMSYHEKIQKMFNMPDVHFPSEYTVLEADYMLSKELQEDLRQQYMEDKVNAKDKSIDYVEERQEARKQRRRKEHLRDVAQNGMPGNFDDTVPFPTEDNLGELDDLF